jgi:hypothetical protein
MENFKRRGRNKKIRIPSESEYYACFEKWNPDRQNYLKESTRQHMWDLKNNPPDYQLIKKIYEEINSNNGYR